MLLLQDHIDYLLEIKLTRFSILTPTDNLFFLDPNIEHDLSQLQTNYQLKLSEIAQKIERMTEEKLKSERLKLLLQSLEETLNVQEKHLGEITHQRQLDNESFFSNLSPLSQRIDQIQNQLKDSSKQLNQLANETSIESLRHRFESLRSIANDEYIQFNRLTNEYKLLNQMNNNHDELKDEINECIVNLLQYADNRSRLVSPELEQRSGTDQLVQLNIYQIQVREQLTIVEQQSSSSSAYLQGRLNELREDILSLKDEIESILEKENETTSIQMKVDRLFETLQNQFDHQPTFSSILTSDTFENYEQLSGNYLQSLYQLERELEQTIEQFPDTGLLRQYQTKFNTFKEREEQLGMNLKKHLEHLRQGLSEHQQLQHQLQTIVEDLNDCENQLTNTKTMKEYQLEQKLQVKYRRNGVFRRTLTCVLGSTNHVREY